MLFFIIIFILSEIGSILVFPHHITDFNTLNGNYNTAYSNGYYCKELRCSYSRKSDIQRIRPQTFDKSSSETVPSYVPQKYFALKFFMFAVEKQQNKA